MSLIGLLALAGYWIASPDRSAPETTQLDPCGGPDHPCTLAEVSAAAQARTEELADLAMARIASAGDKDLVADWLATQPDVVSVATGSEAVRFRVRGGRGHWIFVQTMGAIATLGAPVLHAPARGPLVPTSMRWSGTPAAVETAAQDAPPSGQAKRALLLSPFRWQWEITGADDGLDAVAQRLRARDYPGTVEVRTERLDPDNPHCQPGAVRWKACRTIGEITLDSFSIWDHYDYIHLVTHGGAVLSDGRSLTAVMTPWTVGTLRNAREVWEAAPDSAGRSDALQIIDAIGIETASVHGVSLSVLPTDVPWLGAGQKHWPLAASLQTVVEAENRAFIESEPVPLNPDLTPAEAAYCRRSLETMSDSARLRNNQSRWMTPDDPKPCARYPDEKTGTGNFIMLSSEFFQATYGGIDNAVILMSACSVGLSDDLLNALKGESTAVIGWTASVTIRAAAEAGKLIAATLVEVDESVEGDSGLTVGQGMTKVRSMIDEARRAPPSEAECEDAEQSAEVAARCAAQYGQVLSVINERPADAMTGAALRVVGDEDVRAREVVYLIGRSGDELRDGSALVISRESRTAGTRDPGALNLTIRVDGLELERNPETVALEIAIDGRPIAVTEPLNRQLADGVWELRHRLPLDREYRPGDVVDLEVRGVLPGGRESRWTYRDIRLLDTWWEVTVTGGPVALPVLSGRHVGRQLHVVVGIADDRAGPEPDLSALPALTIAVSAGKPFVEGANTGLVTMHFRELGYTCAGFGGGGFELTLASITPLDGAFEGRVVCTPGRFDDPTRFVDNIRQGFEAHATGLFRGR